MLDTGLTNALVPKEDVAAVAKSLMGYNIKCEEPSNTGHLSLFQCSCSQSDYNSLKPLQLMIGGQYFDMPVQSYLEKGKETEKGITGYGENR